MTIEDIKLILKIVITVLFAGPLVIMFWVAAIGFTRDVFKKRNNL